MNRFEIRFQWMESDHPDPIERLCAAELSIHAGTICLTELEDLRAQTVRSALRASAYQLAIWFAHNWWRLRWEPEQETLDWRMAHVMAAAGGGYVWPGLSFIGDGESVLLRMRPGTPTLCEGVRYLVYADSSVWIDPFMEAIDGFVEAVIARLRAVGYPDTELEQVWNEVRTERCGVAAQWRKLEALASLDADASEGRYLETLYAQQEEIGPRAIEELVAAHKRHALAALATLLDGCRSAATRLQPDTIEALRATTTTYVEKMRAYQKPDSVQPLPWQLGYEVAALARQHWNLQPGKISNTTIGQLFGIPEKFLDQATETISFPLSAGYREDTHAGLAVWLGRRPRSGRRFALARLLGDHLCSVEQERLLPATQSKTAQQKFQRAFAQQFLCPINDLIEFLDTEKPDDEQIEEAASEFDVSPLLVRSTLVNHGLIGRETLQGYE